MDDKNLLAKIRAREVKIGVLGLGHVGLPTALGLAELGWDVMGADSDSGVVSLIQAGQSPFYEPGLEELLSRHLETKTFTPVNDLDSAIRAASVLFLCVGTPQRENGEADLSQIEGVANTIAANLNDYKLIVEKSTVPAITGQWIKRIIQRSANVSLVMGASAMPGTRSHPSQAGAASTTNFDVASNPEFLQEGKALEDFFHPHRVIFGVESDRAREILVEIYRPLECPILVTDLNTAELIKHAANALLATKISFINMVADLCEAVGGDITKVAEGLGSDPRIGPHFLQAGIGFGGYCLPKDLRAFIHLAEEHGVDFSLLKEVERVNEKRADLFVKKIQQKLWVLRGKTVGLLGLAFKPGTDDIREARSLKIAESLLREGAILRLYDPRAMPSMGRVLPEQVGRLTYCSSAYEAARGAHALVLLTEWEEFRHLDLVRARALMKVPVLVDGRNLYVPEQVRAAGFEYVSMGR